MLSRTKLAASGASNCWRLLHRGEIGRSGATSKAAVPTSSRMQGLGSKAALLVIVGLVRFITVFFSTPTSPNIDERAARMLQAIQEDRPAQCASLKYATMTCPTWDPTKPDGGQDVDFRVRWMHKHQHPADCRAANYLIKPLSLHCGFGANMQLTFMSGLYVTMYANRIFLLDPIIPFRYANCEKREWSCYFEPLSSCTLEDADQILNVTGLGYQTMLLDPEHRVLRPEVLEASVPIVHPWEWYKRSKSSDNPWWKDLIMFPGDEEILAGALMYAMRPGLRVKTQVEQALHNALSRHCDFDPDRTISMPVRGSDKCMGSLHRTDGMEGENTCYLGLLDKYMQMAEDIRRLDPKVDTIILTSEDDRYLQDRHRFEADGRWRFIVNEGDTAGGTGSIGVLEKEKHDMSDVFVSFFSSLHLQMRGRYYILNCRSNFHLILKMLVKHGGCSYSRSPIVYCLTEQYADYKMCPLEKHRACMETKLEEVAAKNRLLGTNITVDLSSLTAPNVPTMTDAD